MKAQKCKLYIGTRYKMIDMGEFKSKNAAKQYIRDLGYPVVHKII